MKLVLLSVHLVLAAGAQLAARPLGKRDDEIEKAATYSPVIYLVPVASKSSVVDAKSPSMWSMPQSALHLMGRYVLSEGTMSQGRPVYELANDAAEDSATPRPIVMRYHNGNWVLQESLDSKYYKMGSAAQSKKETARPEELGTAIWHIPENNGQPKREHLLHVADESAGKELYDRFRRTIDKAVMNGLHRVRLSSGPMPKKFKHLEGALTVYNERKGVRYHQRRVFDSDNGKFVLAFEPYVAGWLVSRTEMFGKLDGVLIAKGFAVNPENTPPGGWEAASENDKMWIKTVNGLRIRPVEADEPSTPGVEVLSAQRVQLGGEGEDRIHDQSRAKMSLAATALLIACSAIVVGRLFSKSRGKECENAKKPSAGPGKPVKGEASAGKGASASAGSGSGDGQSTMNAKRRENVSDAGRGCDAGREPGRKSTRRPKSADTPKEAKKQLPKAADAAAHVPKAAGSPRIQKSHSDVVSTSEKTLEQERKEAAAVVEVAKNAPEVIKEPEVMPEALATEESPEPVDSGVDALRAELEAQRAAREELERQLSSMRRMAQAEAEKHTEDDERSLCVVCMEEPKTHIFSACMHKCVCEGCAHAIEAKCGINCAVCPLCRVASERVEFVYE